ncbi:hypothetical protein B0T24DRAFT_239542 [Lasiosphaeria ovina]|uniref:Uncharacterized protein n=1 Tax=Lasiosphaeria ovina TaxID=92902 RepID=A0AAE0KJJ9_9PEZI|nr:hypothetical protein B0T24DRAFT_239542 [Lasiosphaeria ovina]
MQAWGTRNSRVAIHPPFQPFHRQRGSQALPNCLSSPEIVPLSRSDRGTTKTSGPQINQGGHASLSAIPYCSHMAPTRRKNGTAVHKTRPGPGWHRCQVRGGNKNGQNQVVSLRSRGGLQALVRLRSHTSHTIPYEQQTKLSRFSLALAGSVSQLSQVEPDMFAAAITAAEQLHNATPLANMFCRWNHGYVSRPRVSRQAGGRGAHHPCSAPAQTVCSLKFGREFPIKLHSARVN